MSDISGLSDFGKGTHVSLLKFLLVFSDRELNVSVLTCVGDARSAHEFDLFPVALVLSLVSFLYVVHKVDVLVRIGELLTVLLKTLHDAGVFV